MYVVERESHILILPYLLSLCTEEYWRCIMCILVKMLHIITLCKSTKWKKWDTMVSFEVPSSMCIESNHIYFISSIESWMLKSLQYISFILVISETTRMCIVQSISINMNQLLLLVWFVSRCCTIVVLCWINKLLKFINLRSSFHFYTCTDVIGYHLWRIARDLCSRSFHSQR